MPKLPVLLVFCESRSLFIFNLLNRSTPPEVFFNQRLHPGCEQHITLSKSFTTSLPSAKFSLLPTTRPFPRMTQPNTRPKNVNQHPGEIVLKTKQKRRTARQIQEDNNRIKHEQQEQEAAAQRNANRIAAIEDQRALKDLKIIMDPPRPRPQARPVSKVKKLVSIAEEEDVEIMDAVDEDDVQPVDGNPEEVQTHHNNIETDHVMSSSEELAEVQPRRKHVQKMAHREAVQVVRLVDNAGVNQKKNQRDVEARVMLIGDQKWKKGAAADVGMVKNDYAGIRKTKDWAEKLTTSNVRESDTSLLDDDDSLEHEATHNAIKKTQTGDSARCTASDVVKVSSLSSPHTSRPANNTEEAEDKAPSAPVAGKGIKHLTTSHNNTWRRVFIPTVAHRAGRDIEPWGPDDHELRDIMQDIWNHIYKGKIEHEISSSGAVLKVFEDQTASHGMAQCGDKKWLGCSGSKKESGEGTPSQVFFAQDTVFLDPEACKEFSQAMLKQNHFIFRDNAGLAPKGWTGMWRASFILQMFASHLNFTHGHVEIPNLHTKGISARAAFTLAVTAVCRILQLVRHLDTIIKKGKEFAFSKPVLGPMTQKFMQPIMALPDEDFTSIVQEAQEYAKHLRSTGSSRATSNVMPDEDNGFADLFAFC
ncbi:hypothetical protein DFJ58DRAFT_841352 [Suillus subalutaceus]|uniref:uncharacterized protein n=1 Tax=Suillus subalutaceus TaxID=48586 RepID=UPI001B87A549|nr:uncharacterized protein DFJ58DRAFT_841352 [Suillus subalutaceus]KAG1854432.1 hypothetical protein DFJ58DRAFT_841352 [Suillus subalutaceus]